MKKIFGILTSIAALTAGAFVAFYFILKNRKQEDPDSGLYTVNVFKKIACDINHSIAETEDRLAKHDELQKAYDNMEWKAP